MTVACTGNRPGDWVPVVNDDFYTYMSEDAWVPLSPRGYPESTLSCQVWISRLGPVTGRRPRIPHHPRFPLNDDLDCRPQRSEVEPEPLRNGISQGRFVLVPIAFGLSAVVIYGAAVHFDDPLRGFRSRLGSEFAERFPGSYYDTMKLGNKHRKTLRALFADPLRSDLKWVDIEKLLRALGAERRSRLPSPSTSSGCPSCLSSAAPGTRHRQGCAQIRTTIPEASGSRVGELNDAEIQGLHGPCGAR